MLPEPLARVAMAWMLIAGAGVTTALAAPRNAGAVVLVNSQSPDYAEFQELLAPYLVQFGVPYTVTDISSGRSATLPGAALYILGHRGLDPARRFFDHRLERALLEAVRGGAGLVSFDGVLAAGRGKERKPLYSWPQEIFGFTYAPGVEAAEIAIDGAHFITAQRPVPRSVKLKAPLTVPHATPAGQPSVLARAGGAPLLIAALYGSGRAVQFTSFDWVRPEIEGRIYGLDDLVWRSLVWAARKPFAVRGMPKLLAFRVDDVSGFGLGSNQHLGWVLKANAHGLKPWLGLFIDDLRDDPAALQRLSALTQQGLATASVHARRWSKFFFLDEPLIVDDRRQNIAGRPWPDERMAANFEEAEQFFAARRIVKSKVVLPHFYEFEPNNFEGLKRWGAEFTGTVLEPGQGYGALVPKAAPYLESGPPRDSAGRDPVYIADWLRVPGRPEYDRLLFNLVVEVRDVTGYEWAPSGVPVAEAIRRAVEETRREWDSGLPGVLFTHESDHIRHIRPEDWDSILAGVIEQLKPDGPLPVTLDALCRYVRALKTSTLRGARFDEVLGEGSLELEGSADVPTRLYLYDSDDPPRELEAPAFRRRTLLRWKAAESRLR